MILEATGRGFHLLTVCKSHVLLPANRPVTRKSSKRVPSCSQPLNQHVGTICAYVVRRCGFVRTPRWVRRDSIIWVGSKPGPSPASSSTLVSDSSPIRGLASPEQGGVVMDVRAQPDAHPMKKGVLKARCLRLLSAPVVCCPSKSPQLMAGVFLREWHGNLDSPLVVPLGSQGQRRFTVEPRPLASLFFSTHCV